jgi:hypothetical protein|tara:strand:+ start:140 stop:349 length:210 start_codon:yes stop_codon:yes gene_type:complete
MYTIRIKEIRTGEISFDTLEEAKQWHENREGDVYWYHDDERCNLEKAMDDDGLGSVVTVEDITKEVDWL